MWRRKIRLRRLGMATYQKGVFISFKALRFDHIIEMNKIYTFNVHWKKKSYKYIPVIYLTIHLPARFHVVEIRHINCVHFVYALVYTVIVNAPLPPLNLCLVPGEWRILNGSPSFVQVARTSIGYTKQLVFYRFMIFKSHLSF